MVYRAKADTGGRTRQRNRLVAVACVCVFVVTIAVQSYSVSSPTELRLTSSGTYDLPKFLNVPAFTDPELSPDGSSITRAAARAAAARPASILRFYRDMPGTCARQPYRPHLRSAVKRWGQISGYDKDAAVDMVRKNDTLLLHFVSEKSTDKNVSSLSEQFVKDMLYRANFFTTVVLLPSRGEGTSRSDQQKDLDFLKRWLREEDVSVRVSEPRGTDEMVYLMYAAKHLFVHRDDLSALGALASQGTVYLTEEMKPFTKQNEFRWLISDGKPAVDKKVFMPRRALNYVGPVHPSCCNLEPFGKKDGEKIICGNAKGFQKKSCWVLSVGCGGRWSFEEGVAEKTGCAIHTFDCTGNFDIPASLNGRAFIHKLCLGQENDSRKNYIGWNKMIEIGASQSGLKAEKMPAIAKMDIEGHEFPVLRSLMEQGKESTLPEQLAMELHSTTSRDVGPPFFKKSPDAKNTMVSFETISGLFQNLSSRGYRLVHRADNPYCAHCSEVTLVRTVGLPDVN